MDRLKKKQLSRTLHGLRIRANKRDFKFHFLRRMIQHSSNYRLRHYFLQWAHKANCEKVADDVNVS